MLNSGKFNFRKFRKAEHAFMGYPLPERGIDPANMMHCMIPIPSHAFLDASYIMSYVYQLSLGEF